MTPRIRRPFRLSLLELEARDVPTWYDVAAPDPAAGTLGSTDAAHAGNLILNPDYEAVNGVVTVWADTPAAAAAEAVRGTITVTIGGQSVDQVFGPATVGVPADHKAFAVAVSGAMVSVVMEDLVGFAGVTPDFDYDDRTWGGVEVVSAADPLVAEGKWTWTAPKTGETATVAMRVTAASPDQFIWKYDVKNDNMSVRYTQLPGMMSFTLGGGDRAAVSDAKASLANWAFDDGGIGWHAVDEYGGPFLTRGQTATFSFRTPPVPVDPVGPTDGQMLPAPWWDADLQAGVYENVIARGTAKVPGVVKVEITHWNGDPVGVEGLKVARWQEAFEVVNGIPAVKRVDGVTGFDIIDLDTDRFNVWVYDKGKWDANTPHIGVKISTDNVAGFTAYNDPAHEVDLVRYTGDRKGAGVAGQGWFWSD